MSINKCFFVGNLTRDPEVKQTKSGMSVMQFGLAVNDRRKNQQGEYEDKPNYLDCTLFGNRVDWVSRSVSRGTKVAICCRVDYQSWQDKDGNNRNKIAFIVDEIEVLASSKGGGNANSGGGLSGQNSANDLYATDIPF